MTKARPRTGLVLPTILTLMVLAVLLGLGTWQLKRKAWKDGLIAQIEARTAAPPIPFEEALARVRKGEDLEYARVKIVGNWLSAQELHLWVASKSGPGWHVYAPLSVATAQSGIRTVIVNRGFVPDARRDPATRPEPRTAAGEDAIELVGLLRKPEVKVAFTPDNDVTRNIWYWRDVTGMASALGLDERTVAPFVLDAEKGAPGSPLGPQAGVTRLELPNSHLQYAVTWYGLAVTLIGVYAAFVWGSFKRP